MTAITVGLDPIKYPDDGGMAAIAGAAIVEKYACVKMSAAGTVIETAGANEAGCGFIAEVSAMGTTANGPASGDLVTVYTRGRVWAVAVGALSTIGVLLTTAAGGRVGAASAGNTIVGRLLGTATGAGELVPVEVFFGSA